MLLQHPEVRYEPTNLCNAHCIMCPREKMDRQTGIMDQEKYEASIDEVVELGATRVTLTGFGEPMLDRKLEEKVDYAKRKGLKVHIITNGSVLTMQRSVGLLLAGLDEIRISFYGTRQESYESVMRQLDFRRASDNLENLIFARNTGAHKTKIMLSFLVMPENEKDVEMFKCRWESKVDSIEIWKPHNWSDGREYRIRMGEKNTCGRPENGPLQIQWNGDVIPCCYDYNNSMVLGNAFEQSVVDILKGEKYEALREAHRKKEFERFPFCNNCDQLLEHADALVYSNRHSLPAEQAVKLSNTDLYNLKEAKEFNE